MLDVDKATEFLRENPDVAVVEVATGRMVGSTDVFPAKPEFARRCTSCGAAQPTLVGQIAGGAAC